MKPEWIDAILEHAGEVRPCPVCEGWFQASLPGVILGDGKSCTAAADSAEDAWRFLRCQIEENYYFIVRQLSILALQTREVEA